MAIGLCLCRALVSIQAWTDGTRGWWHILPSLEIHERAQSLDDPELTGLLSDRTGRTRT